MTRQSSKRSRGAFGRLNRETSGQEAKEGSDLPRTNRSSVSAAVIRDAPLPTLPDLETVRGAARRGQTERAVSTTVDIRAVKHDLGALELRADGEADSKRQKSKAYCFPARGQCASDRL